jgi:hypothetical protein
MVQAAGMLIVDVLDQATLLELGQLQPSRQRAVLFPSPLAVYQQAEPLFEAQLAGIGALILFTEGLGHAVQLHGLQSLHRRLIQHVYLLVGVIALLQQRRGRRIVIRGAANVVMLRAGLLHFQFKYSLPVERSFQNRFQALVGVRVQQQGALAGRLQAYRGVSLGQAHDAQASAVTHLRMRLAFEDDPHQLRSRWAYIRGPVDQPRRRPLQVGLMAFGTVVVQRGRRMCHQPAAMGGDAHAMIEDLDGGRRVARLQFLAHQLIRNAVIMSLDLDVIVDVRTDLLSLRQDVAFHRQGPQGGLVQLFEQAGSAGIPAFAERSSVQSIQQRRDGFVEVCQREEPGVTQRRHNPALSYLHAGLDLRLISGLVWTRRKNGQPIVFGHLAVGWI